MVTPPLRLLELQHAWQCTQASKDLLALLQEDLSLGREVELAPDLFEHGERERLLERLEAVTDGGLRAPERARGARHTPRPGHLDEGLEHLDRQDLFHGCTLSGSSTCIQKTNTLHENYQFEHLITPV